MLSGYWRYIGTILGALTVFCLIGFIFFRTYETDTTILNTQEVLRSTAIENKDDSARVTKGSFFINKKNFERDFKKSILKQPMYEDKDVKFTFDYLETRKKGIKGIKVFVEAEKEIETATCVLALPNN